jgi:hypothetical protein
MVPGISRGTGVRVSSQYPQFTLHVLCDAPYTVVFHYFGLERGILEVARLITSRDGQRRFRGFNYDHGGDLKARGFTDGDPSSDSDHMLNFV